MFSEKFTNYFNAKRGSPQIVGQTFFILATYRNLRKNFEIINFLEVWK